MTRTRVFAVVLSVMAAVVGAQASKVAAAAPSNDSSAAAQSLQLDVAVTYDNREATAEPIDSTVQAGCRLYTNEVLQSVWFSWSSGANPPTALALDFTAQSLGTRFAVYAGDIVDPLVCSTEAMTRTFFQVQPNTVYTVVVFEVPGGAGGTGSVKLSPLPPAAASATLTGDGIVQTSTGTALVYGSLTCDNASFITLTTTLTQPTKKGVFSSTVTQEYFCMSGNLSLLFLRTTKGFVPGKATATISYSTCGPVGPCATGTVQASVTLKGVKQLPM